MQASGTLARRRCTLKKPTLSGIYVGDVRLDGPGTGASRRALLPPDSRASRRPHSLPPKRAMRSRMSLERTCNFLPRSRVTAGRVPVLPFSEHSAAGLVLAMPALRTRLKTAPFPFLTFVYSEYFVALLTWCPEHVLDWSVHRTISPTHCKCSPSGNKLWSRSRQAILSDVANLEVGRKVLVRKTRWREGRSHRSLSTPGC